MVPQDKDCDSRADKYWSASISEAEKHDRALMEPVKDDMNRIIIFVRSWKS
jgi:hypothetical protein